MTTRSTAVDPVLAQVESAVRFDRRSAGRVMDGAVAGRPLAGATTRGWDARLEVGVALRGDASVAVHRRHLGPLRLQKPLYPEGPGIAHLLVVHPPAGIAVGDRLAIDIEVGPDASTLVTTQGRRSGIDRTGHRRRSTSR